MTADAPAGTTRLEVAREPFLQELKRIANILGRRNAGEALLRFTDGALHLQIGGAAFSLPASGHWIGEARIAASWLRAIARVPPPGDPLVLQVAAGRFRIGGSSTPCHFQVPGSARLEVPLQPDLPSLLRLGLAHDEAALVSAGLLPLVEGARKELDRRITQAAKSLAPLGVSDTDLRLLVVGKLAQGD